jgi:hypothetical protein
MGEAVYNLKAQFRSKKEAAIACKDLNKFLDENDKAIESNSNSRSKDPKDFPRIKEYFQIIKEEELQDYHYEDEQAYCIGDVLIFSANVGHLGSWDNLQTFITEKYKPLKVVWGSEEYGGSMESLNLYAWEDIVKGILKCKKTLPLLLGIHDDLDALIALHLKK